MNGQESDGAKIWINIVLTLFVAGVVVALVALVVTNVKKQQSKMTAMLDNVDESVFTQYDGVTISGSEVLGAIKSLEGYNISIEVNNGSTTKTYLYKSDLTTKATDKLADASKRGNAAYITPKAQFDGEIVRDSSTDVITTIKFTKVS